MAEILNELKYYTFDLNKQVPDGAFVFDDGSIGEMTDICDGYQDFVDSVIDEYRDEDDSVEEVAEWMEDYYNGLLKDEEKESHVEAELIRVFGCIPVGEIYTTTFSKENGETDYATCWYYKGESFEDFCDNNNIPVPVKRIEWEDFYAVGEYFSTLADLIRAKEKAERKSEEVRQRSDRVPELKQFL